MKYGYLENVDDIEFFLPKDDIRTSNLLNSLTKAGKPNVYIGLPVFSDKTFVSTLYPKSTIQKNFLKAYSQQFNCIEVNSTRFGVPSVKTQNDWLSKVNDNFKFSFKMPQVITNRKDMNDYGGKLQTDKFLQCLDYFGKKTGMTYMLLPKYFNMNRWVMVKKFLDSYPTDLPLAIEARNADFHQNDEVYEYLKTRNITLAITDVPGRRDVLHQTLTTDSVFVRFGGANLHPSDFLRIDQWVEKLSFWLEQGVKNVWFFIHQPAPFRFKSGILVSYLIEKLNKLNLDIKLKQPVNYALNE